ncbi:MAG TPA: shikimate kinase [Candidatus Saccharimonadales bacterium]|nr:shikimate kinase [Candidatus Saccharimonadales bacterium]
MRLVFIYGPPAVGKTTIGRIVSQTTGFSFFFNHATVPAARAVFPDHHNPRFKDAYSQLLKSFRLSGIAAAARQDVDIIFTLAYSGSVDDAFIKEIVNVVKDRGGSVYFVQLHAADEILFSRVHTKEREALLKITDPTRLAALLKERDLRASVPYDDILHIDTEHVAAEEAAQQIIETFRLPQYRQRE